MSSATPLPANTSSSSTFNKCFNLDCKELKSRKGWKLRSGELAELCDRCASAYEEGKFCELFHVNATGWRSCESCGKRIHCGCIVSIHAFMLLDAGGVECLACARKNVVPAFQASNAVWPQPLLYHHAPLSERLKDLSFKSWSQLAGSGPVPWRQAPSLFNSSTPQTELHSTVRCEVGRSNAGEILSSPSMEKGKIDSFSERLMSGSLKLGARDIVENGKAGTNSEEQSNSCLNTQQLSIREDACAHQYAMTLPYTSINDRNVQTGGCITPSRPIPAPSLPKQFHGNIYNGIDSPVDSHTQNGRPRADARGRSQLLPRYWPRFTNEELQQISGNSNSIITPLFEKMLSASDAGRIGRLVLPKKCAEAYFPPISQPEGLPLKVQDSKGKEWTFQFRFWPNNNSRMYVLEGVTPCIQNMRLQAGDIVTFSRLEPEGKLVMGFRKATSAPPSDQENETSKNDNGVSSNGDAELADPSPWTKVDKSGYIAKEVLEAKSSIKKRKSSTLGSKSKRLRHESEDMIELKLTWEEAQGLLRPPPDHLPTVVVIEGFEFEEFEDAPVLGKPTIFATDSMGQKIQWVQCEDCCKWRKLPANALPPSKWTCSSSSWDPERSSCSAVQELTAEQLEELLPSYNIAASGKMKPAKQDTDDIEALEGLDTLANLAILGEGDASPSSQATTKHPRHRPGCSCIVCIQPPSGKGPKHKQTCLCNVCQTVKRRFKTLTMKREKKQSDKEAETTRKKLQQPLSERLLDDDPCPSSTNVSSSPNKSTNGSSSPNKKKAGSETSDDPNKVKSSTSPFKGQIDLNIQPELEEELSPGSDSGCMIRLLQDANERYLKQSKLLASDCDSASHQTLAGGGVDDKMANGILFVNSHQDAERDAFQMKAPSSAPATG